MKKIILGSAIASLVLGGWFYVGEIESRFESAINERLDKLKIDTGMEVTNHVSETYFDYLSLSLVNKGVQVQFGANPGIATINVGSVEYKVLEERLYFNDFDVLSILPSGGALSLMSLKELSVNYIEPGDEDGAVQVELKSVSLSDDVYKQIITSSYSDDIISLISGKEFDVSLDRSVSDVDGFVDVDFKIDMANVMGFSVDFDFKAVPTPPNGTALDPDTGMPLEFVKTTENYLVSSFGIELVDKGVRDSAYKLAALNLEQPSVDDVVNFKDKVVEAYDTYVSDIAINPMLPFDAMHGFTGFLDSGGTFSTNVRFQHPVNSINLLDHLLGMPVAGIYDGSEVTVK